MKSNETRESSISAATVSYSTVSLNIILKALPMAHLLCDKIILKRVTAYLLLDKKLGNFNGVAPTRRLQLGF